MCIELKMLPAFQGDSILINCKTEDFKILVDTGTKRTYSRGILKSEIEKIDKIDLLILTHIDEDHIGGILKYYDDIDRKQGVFKKIWFNTGELILENIIKTPGLAPEIIIDESGNLSLSIKQGLTLEKKIANDLLSPNELIKSLDNYSFKKIRINVLSPEVDDLRELYYKWEMEVESQLEMTRSNDYDKPIKDLLNIQYVENGTIANKSSIAFLLSFNKLNLLFMGDAYPSIIEKNLRILGYNETNKLLLNFVKVAHHGGIYGISPSLLKIIDCTKFIISTNGSNGLPFKECLARIISHRKEKVFLYFNYKNDIIESIFTVQDFEQYDFEIIYLTDKNNYSIEVYE